MAAGVKVEGADRVVAALRARELAVRREAGVRVAVGYSAPYALSVHENLEAFHPNGSAKYLEQPLRQNAAELAAVAREELARGGSLTQAELAAARRLLELSQALVPVRTGALKNSAFVRQEG